MERQPAKLAVKTKAITGASWQDKTKDPEPGRRRHAFHFSAADRADNSERKRQDSSNRARAADYEPPEPGAGASCPFNLARTTGPGKQSANAVCLANDAPGDPPRDLAARRCGRIASAGHSRRFRAYGDG